VAAAGVAGVGDRSGCGLQGGGQGGGAVADVIVRLPLGDARPHRQDRPGPVQGLALCFLIHADHHRVLRRRQVQARDVADLRVQLRAGGEREPLGPVRGQAELATAPRSSHG
jgi:hypothetical protein